MSLVWEIKRVGSNAYAVIRDGIHMLPIHVEQGFAKEFVKKARNPDDRVCVTDGTGTKFVTKEFSRSKPKR